MHFATLDKDKTLNQQQLHKGIEDFKAGKADQDANDEPVYAGAGGAGGAGGVGGADESGDGAVSQHLPDPSGFVDQASGDDDDDAPKEASSTGEYYRTCSTL